jgi:hypothetical protein
MDKFITIFIPQEKEIDLKKLLDEVYQFCTTLEIVWQSRGTSCQ